jgi:hypothetical protein
LSLKFKIIIPVVFLVPLSPFIFDMMAVQKLKWAEIQRYGGIKIEKPLETQDGYYMPIVCDVSGLDSITVRPTGVSSWNTFKRTKVSIKDHFIFISVSISGPFYGEGTTKCKAAKIGKLEHGHYLVYYETGEQIGEFYI